MSEDCYTESSRAGSHPFCVVIEDGAASANRSSDLRRRKRVILSFKRVEMVIAAFSAQQLENCTENFPNLTWIRL